MMECMYPCNIQSLVLTFLTDILKKVENIKFI